MVLLFLFYWFPRQNWMFVLTQNDCSESAEACDEIKGHSRNPVTTAIVSKMPTPPSAPFPPHNRVREMHAT